MFVPHRFVILLHVEIVFLNKAGHQLCLRKAGFATVLQVYASRASLLKVLQSVLRCRMADHQMSEFSLLSLGCLRHLAFAGVHKLSLVPFFSSGII
jgi:hypothetical protein